MGFKELESTQLPEAILSLSKGMLKTFNTVLSTEEESVAVKTFEEDIKGELEELNSNEVLTSRHEYHEIPSSQLQDFRESVFTDEKGTFYKMGIRHFNGEKDLPFVKVFSSEDILSDGLNELKEFIREKYGVFSPLHLSFEYPSRADVDFIASVTMVTRAKSYQELPTYNLEDDLLLKVEKEESILDWYEEGYRKFHEKYPDLKIKVPVNDRETMMDSLNQGLLHSAFLNSERVGLIASIKSPFLGQEGLYFNEIFIVEDMKGKGLGKTLQKLAVLDVCEGNEFVWGTIDETNLASYKTAYANGRRPVSYECFVKLDS